MCLAVPGKVAALKGNIAVVDFFGNKTEADASLVKVSVGDSVFVSAGFVTHKLSPEEAERSADAWKRI